MPHHTSFEGKRANAGLLRDEVGRRRRPAGCAVSPYPSEQTEYRDVDREAVDDHLRRNGLRSYDGLEHAEELWAHRD